MHERKIPLFMRFSTVGFLAFLMATMSQAALVAEPWATLPPTPSPVLKAHTGYTAVNGIRLFYSVIGEGSPVVLLHSGLANSDWWGNQVNVLAVHHKVVLLDSRGHGRSTRDAKPYSYELMASDVVSLLDSLKIAKADIVGWSDGAILGLYLAIHHPNRVGKVFAFGANTTTAGLIIGAEKTPTFTAYFARVAHEYSKISPTPTEFSDFVAQINMMWMREPNWSDEQLKSIKSPVWIVAGDHEEAIQRSHTEHIAATIPGAGLLILPKVGHFAPLQDPDLFNAVLLQFLDGER
jgi:pimeloyl-ACP methyl ester carboxylesterase